MLIHASIGRARPGRVTAPDHRVSTAPISPEGGSGGLGRRLTAAPILTAALLSAAAPLLWSGPVRAQYAAGTGASATGPGATAVGEDSTATGVAATAVGKGAQAIGPYSFAQGFNASAGPAYAMTGLGGGIAVGTGATAGPVPGGSNIAIGSQAIATSPDGTGDNIAFGTDARATGRDSTAIGAQTTASGTNSIAIGNNFPTSASSDSIVVGVGSRAPSNAAGSVVLGNNAQSGAVGGVALGFGSLALRGALNGPEAFSGAAVAGSLGAVSVGNATNLRQVTNLAGGTQDTDAVNLRQLRGAGNALAGALGGGATFSADGTLTAPKYSVQGQVLNTVGGAISTLDSAITTLNTAGSRYFAVRTTGPAAQALGTDSVAIGAGATALRGVALGTGSVADRAGLDGAAEAFSGTSVASNAGALAVGAVGAERQITNVAGGTAETDAVNLRQLRAVGGNLANALGGSAGFGADGRFTGPNYAVNGRTYGNVGGALAALDTSGVKYDVDASTGGRANSVTLAGAIRTSRCSCATSRPGWRRPMRPISGRWPRRWQRPAARASPTRTSRSPPATTNPPTTPTGASPPSTSA